MIGRRGLLTLWACLLLAATLCPCALSRRGGFGRGFGGGMGRSGARAPPIQSRGSSNTGMKVAGAAAAGALGGAVIGHGLGSMGRGGYGGYGYGGYGSQGYGGYGRYPGYGGGYGSRGYTYNETDGQYYRDASSPSIVSNSIVVLGSMVSFVIGYWMGI